MTTKPAIVLLHGAWHRPSHFSALIEKLQGQGYEVEAPATASAADAAVSDVFEQDVGIATQATKTFTDNGKTVVVAMHSYGSVYGSDAVAELSKEIQAGSGKGRIVHLFYIAAVILEQGTSVGEDGLAQHALDVADGLLYNLEPYNRFYNTSPSHEARKDISQLKPQAAESFTTKTKYRGWADHGIPVTYLACDRDQAISPDIDVARFLKRFEVAGLKDFTPQRIDCDHSPWISAEEEFTKVMNEVLEKASTAAVA